jgi:thioredoxin reductase
MAVDYDLVVIGSSWVGIYAAQKAVQLQARVALVTSCDDLFLPNDALTINTLSEVGRWNYQLAHHPVTEVSARVSLTAAKDWTNRVTSG